MNNQDVPINFMLCCIGCGAIKEVPIEKIADKEFSKYLFARGEWVLSIVSPPGTRKIVLAPLCGDCAKRVHHKAVLDKAREEFSR